jgi:hypothetical protein
MSFFSTAVAHSRAPTPILGSLAAGAMALAMMLAAAQLRSQEASGLTMAHMGGDTAATMPMSSAPLGLAMQRTGSGTSWQPDASPMRAAQHRLGGWDLMLHGVAFLQYDDQGSSRGDRQFGSVNWGMISASHVLAGGTLTLLGMGSAEPLTVTGRGYPLLLQSGEVYQGQPLHDRQHPHDLFMELAALYDHAVTRNLAVSLYVAPVGEPAIGPVAFPHRPSAANNLLAPLGHHWQDATHVSFGVITAGVYTRSIKLEGSIFNGREPDEIRTNFDYRGRSLDSYAGRLTVNPDEHWSLSGSYAYLASPEQLDPSRSVHRIAASAMYGREFGTSGNWASTLLYGANRETGEPGLSNSVLGETNIEMDSLNSIFGRAEFARKSAGDLDVALPTPDPADRPEFDVSEITLGYVRELASYRGGSLGIGVAGTLNVIPQALQFVYGSRTPVGGVIFLRIRPGLMSMDMHTTDKPKMPMHDMPDMREARKSAQ